MTPRGLNGGVAVARAAKPRRAPRATPAPAHLQLREYVPTWQASLESEVRAGEVSAKYASDSVTALERHVLPVLGRRELARISRNDVTHVVEAMAHRGVSLSTARIAVGALRKLLRAAVADSVAPPRVLDSVRTPPLAAHFGPSAKDAGARASGPARGSGARAAGVPAAKASDVVATQLRARIVAGDLVEGARLPVERDMATEFGVSRTAVREALRVLEVEGLVSRSPGRGGGCFVRRPDYDTMTRTVSGFIAGRQVRMTSLLQIRSALEPLAAELAARHRTDWELEMLESLHAQQAAAYDDLPEFHRLNAEWHIAVVRAGHNELMYAFILSLSDAIVAGAHISDGAPEDFRAGALRAHERVMAAIRAQDPELAHEAMTVHLTAYRGQVKRRLTEDPDSASRPAVRSVIV